MIVKTSKGYKVTNESGSKNLSKPNLSKGQALKRLQQIEYFKHGDKPRKSPKNFTSVGMPS